MQKVVKRSVSEKILILLGAILVGLGLGNLSKGYKDRNEYIEPLSGLASKALESKPVLIDIDNKTEVTMQLTSQELTLLTNVKIYNQRTQTKLTRIPYWVNLLVILLGVVILSYSKKTSREQRI